MQSRDSMSLTDRESSSDESDCSLETVQSFARGTPRKRKRNAKCGGEKPAAKQSREEGEKGGGGGGDTPNDTETAKRDNEVVTSGKQRAATSEQTPAEGPSTRKGEVAKPQPMGKAMRQGIGQPVLCDHPVIIEDLMRPGPARLRSLDWKTADILKNEVGTVRSIRPISESKTVVGCDISLQQSRLVKRLKIGQVEVKCTIPEPTVQGVVRGVPRNVQMDEFMKRIEWVSDNGGHTHSKVKVKGASRLTFKDGTASRAIRVTFVAQKLFSEQLLGTTTWICILFLSHSFSLLLPLPLLFPLSLSVSTQAARVSRCAEGKTQAARVWCAESEQSNPGRTGTVCGA